MDADSVRRDQHGHGTYAAQLGTYTLNDRLVEATFHIDAAFAAAPSGNIAIGGLPFPSASATANPAAACVIGFANRISTVTSQSQLGATVPSNATAAQLWEFGGAGAGRVQGSQLPRETVLYGKCSYPLY